jgi:hypothetical protein
MPDQLNPPRSLVSLKLRAESGLTPPNRRRERPLSRKDYWRVQVRSRAATPPIETAGCRFPPCKTADAAGPESFPPDGAPYRLVQVHPAARAAIDLRAAPNSSHRRAERPPASRAGDREHPQHEPPRKDHSDPRLSEQQHEGCRLLGEKARPIVQRDPQALQRSIGQQEDQHEPPEAPLDEAPDRHDASIYLG